MSSSEAVAQLTNLLRASSKVVAFTGAGISTESGIPDFRSPGGIWSKIQPIDFSDFLASEDWRRETWRRKIASGDTFSGAKPNAGHLALKRLHELGRLSAVVTQNVDGLHQISGIPDDLVVELHGNANYATCLSCSERFELEPILEAFREDESLPECSSCGGIVKTATISFGQPMPAEPMRDAERYTTDCDLYLVLGSSLVVYPAAGFPVLAKESGAALVIVNREPTQLDGVADLVINDELGPTLSSAVEALEPPAN